MEPGGRAAPDLRPLRRAVIDHLVACVRERGKLELSAWQVFCVTTWWSAACRPEALRLRALEPLDHADAATLFEDCVAVVLYSYQAETDSFTKTSEEPIPWAAPAPPLPTTAPGTGILAHVARTGRPYRTRTIHVDLRTQNCVEDVKRGLGDVMYGQVKGLLTSWIVAVSAPASGLLDGLSLETFTQLVRDHVRPPEQEVAKPEDDAPFIIRFDGRADFPPGLLADLLCPQGPDHPASARTPGLVVGAVREGTADRDQTNKWVWRRIAGDIGPVRLARSIIRTAHLGSLFESYRGAKHDEVDRWRSSQVPLVDGKLTASGLPGMQAYEHDLYRIALRVQDGSQTYGLIRASLPHQPSEARQGSLIELEQKIVRPIAQTITSLRRWFRGTVARAHLCWDLERTLLIRVTDHLAGVSRFDVDDFGRSLDLLHSMLADVEADADESPTDVLKLKDYGSVLRDHFDKLNDAVAVVPWLFRRGVRIADARKVNHAVGLEHPAEWTDRIPRPAVYVAEGSGVFRLVGEHDRNSILGGPASARTYLGALQALLSSVRRSRPSVDKMEWTGPSTVTLSSAEGTLETVTVDLPLGERFLQHLVIFDEGELVFAVHHNLGGPLPCDGRVLRAALAHGRDIGTADTEFHAVAVAWVRDEIGVPLSVALPTAGARLRAQVVTRFGKRLSDPDIWTSAPPPGASFSIDYAASILRHGWYRPSYFKRNMARSTDDVKKLGFIDQYTHHQFSSTGDKPFPYGLKPFGRQLHVYPVTVGRRRDRCFLLHLVTDWEEGRVDPDARHQQRAELRAYLAAVVRKHKGTLEAGASFSVAEYVKYQNGSSGEPVTRAELEALRVQRARFDVAAFLDEPEGRLVFTSTEVSEPTPLTHSQSDVFLVLAMAAPSWLSREAGSYLGPEVYKHVSDMRLAIEPSRRSKSGRKPEHWETRPREIRFSAQNFLVIIPAATAAKLAPLVKKSLVPSKTSSK